MDFHLKETTKCFEELNSSSKGLSSADAAVRLNEYGPNALKEIKKKTLLMMFLDQFKDFMIIVLIGAAIISGSMGEVVDTLAIAAIILLNAIIGFIQEYRAEKAMHALKQMAAPEVVAMRDGMPHNVPSVELVPGDIVLLEAGRIVPADLRVIDASQLKLEEAALTGESFPVEKSTDPLDEESVPLGDRLNMAYQGTIVSYGRGSGIVTDTGMNTELGKIASMLQDQEDMKTPLQYRLAVFGKRLAMAILVVCAIVFAGGLIRGEDALLMLLTSISLAVAAIPEALPAVVTIALAIGAKKLVKQNALIRKLPAVETLGSVTYICSDKTGTLTLNKMTVEEIYCSGRLFLSNEMKLVGEQKISTPESQLPLLFTAMALNNDAALDKNNKVIGDPTEIALFEIAAVKGFVKSALETEYPRVAELPFDSDRKCMTTFHQGEGEIVSYTKGAIESILDRCTGVLVNEAFVDMNEDMRRDIADASESMAEEGLRTLAFALRKWEKLPDDITPDNAEDQLIFLGIAGLLDPPREEAKDAVALCKKAGIHPVMITGDHPLTARTIATRLGIIEEGDEVITGRELQKFTMDEFEEHVGKIRVYARVAPEQKIKIVKALQDRGEFVAMTGDGVNDAPALKSANIGVAMGITGTDVAKEASHMILLDDNFATIVKAVKEGRRMYDNILKFIVYSMTSNAGTVWAVLLAPFFGLPLPLVPVQILWMNLLADSLPGLSLTAEPAESRVMSRPPRRPDEGIFDRGRWVFILKYGLVVGILTLFFQAYAINEEMPWQTMIFTALLLSRLAVVVSVRSEHDSVFQSGLFTNMPLVGAVVLTFALQMAVVYVPALNPIFSTEALSLWEMAITLLLSSVVFFAVEIEKWWFRRKEE